MEFKEDKSGRREEWNLGHLGDRMDLRLFLVFGMMGNGVFTMVFGFGYWLDLHLLGFFVGVQVVYGLFQSIWWPCVVAIVGNWFGKSKRGLIIGVWNSHTWVGNIIGSVVAFGVLEFGWGWSFLEPGVLVIVVGILVFMFRVVSPEDLGLECLGMEVEMNVEVNGDSERVLSEEARLLGNESLDISSFAIGILEAWSLPGVASLLPGLFHRRTCYSSLFF